jgi:asparagine synthase (glutamine-hydrolysing)
MNLFLSNYLLSSQGDRMAMANSVEGRYPFLDHRVIEFASRLPAKLKLNGLNEKYILKKAARGKDTAGDHRPSQAALSGTDQQVLFWG